MNEITDITYPRPSSPFTYSTPSRDDSPTIPLHHNYIQYKSLADALSAVADAHAQLGQKPKIRMTRDGLNKNSASSFKNIEAFKNKVNEDFEMLYSAENSRHEQSFTSLRSSVKSNLSGKTLKKKKYSANLNYNFGTGTSSPEVLVAYGASGSAFEYTEENNSKNSKQQLNAVIVRSLPEVSDYSLRAELNSVQVLQEKIMLATNQGETTSPGKRPKSKVGIWSSLRKVPVIKQKALDGMSQLFELLNEPFIPDGYELSGKHLQLASSVVHSIHDLLNTELFKSIQELPEGKVFSKQKKQVTWAPAGLIPQRPSEIFSGQSSSVSSFDPAMKAKSMKTGFIYDDAAKMFVPKKIYKSKEPQVKKVAKANTLNKFSAKVGRGKTDAEKGIVRIEIDNSDFEPASWHFFRDDQGMYNSHNDYFKGFIDEMMALRSKQLQK